MLEIEYAGGSIYRYHGVPPVEHAALMRADSLGIYVNLRIKPRYPFSRVTDS